MEVNNTKGYGLYSINCTKQVIRNCTFTKTSVGAIFIEVFKVSYINIENSTIKQIAGTGVTIENSLISNEIIFRTDFQYDSRALLLHFHSTGYHHTNISSCKFENNIIPKSAKAIVEIVEYRTRFTQLSLNQSVVIEESLFVGNQGTHVDCSSLHVRNSDNITLSNTNLTVLALLLLHQASLYTIN